MGQCTQKQADILAKYNYNPNTDFESASRIIDALKANNWKRPNGGGNQQQRTNQPPQGYQNQGGRPPQQRPPQQQYQQRPTGGGGGYGYAAPPTTPYPQQQRPQQQQNGSDTSGQCTEKQAALLNKFGYPTNATFAEATVIIDALKANNWQRPDCAGSPAGYDDQGYQPEFEGSGGEAPWGSDVPQFG